MTDSLQSVKLAELLSDFTKKNRNNESLRVYSVTNNLGFTTDYFSKDVFSKNLKTYKVVEMGDFAYNPSRINVGSLDYFKDLDKGIVSPLYITFKVNEDKLDRDYLKYYLKSPIGNSQIRNNTSGSVRDTLNFKQLSRIEIFLPSLVDQKNIVRMFDDINNLTQKRKQAIELLDEYVNSIFFHMFVNNDEEKNIPLVKLEDLSSKITDGVHAKPKYTEAGIPFISVKNITTTRLKLDDCKFVSLSDHKNFTKRCKAELGDILYTKVGATYGRACVVDTEKEFSLYVSVALIKPKNDLIDPIFLKAVLNSNYVKRQADKSVKGAGVPDLHLIEIKKFKIPLPDMKEQKKFAKLVLEVETIKQKMLAQSKELENQFQSLMQKAFKGEL